MLWKQDVDLGYNPIIPTPNPGQHKESSSEDELEKLKALLELKTDKVSAISKWGSSRILSNAFCTRDYPKRKYQ